MQNVVDVSHIHRLSASLCRSTSGYIFQNGRGGVALGIHRENIFYENRFVFVDHVFLVYNVVSIKRLPCAVAFYPTFPDSARYLLCEFFGKILIEPFQTTKWT